MRTFPHAVSFVLLFSSLYNIHSRRQLDEELGFTTLLHNQSEKACYPKKSKRIQKNHYSCTKISFNSIGAALKAMAIRAQGH